MGAAASELLAPGTQLGKYRVIHRIAFGGMAEIYLARASGIQGFEKYVVLKRILPQYASNRELVRMFLQEARLAALLDHANIAQVHDIGEEGGVFFFTMEYLHGEDVRWIAKQLHRRGEGMPLAHAVHVMIDAAAGLHFAHETQGSDGGSLGIVHRDLSPSNIVVTYAGGVKVVDFGVAKIAANPELSGRYALKGKLAYMSPEQVAQGAVDRRSDVYALGIVLYEMTTRSRLFRAENEIETMRLALEAKVAPPSTIAADYPRALERIVMRTLERSPDRRYQSARDLQVDLETFARDQRLEISSVALAEWMQASFGPKREIWHTLPALSASTSEGSGGRGLEPENTAATRKIAAAELVEPLQKIAPPPRPTPRTVPVTAAAALLVLLIGGGAFALRRRNGGDQAAPPAAGSGSGVVVVAENGSVAIEHGGEAVAPGAAAPAALAPAEAPAGQRAPPSVEASPHVRARAARSTRGPGAPEALSSALAKRQAEMRRCFTEQDGRDVGGSEVALRFEVAADGSVTSLAVLPADVGATPLGACLVKVARTTRFAPQPAPITFRIPLTVQLRREHGH
jgi:TonB family protein